MKSKLIAVCIASLFAGASSVPAQQTGLKWTGEVSLGLRYVHVNAGDPSKFREYRDLDTNALTMLDLRAESDTHRFMLFGENIGQDDQYIDVRGSKVGTWKFRLYDNEVRHRFGSGPGARSPYFGIGTNVITALLPNLNPGNWNTFDDSLKRRDAGAMLEWAGFSPWYFRLDGNQVTRDGIKVIGGSQGTSPGNGSVDLPAPVDWTTRNISGEVGYQAANKHLAVNFLQSKFTNGNDVLFWSNGFFAPGAPTNYDRSVLPADNDLWRLGVNGNWRGLPWGSTIAGRVTYSKLTNDVAVLPTMLAAGATNPSTAANAPIFHGEVINTTMSAAINSHPLQALDTKLYYNYKRKDNNSTQMIFAPAAASGLQCGGAACVNELFNYTKNNAGVEAFYRLNRENRFGGGYDYYHTERERIDFPRTNEQKVFAEWKNSTLEWLDTRVKYQFLARRSTYTPVLPPTNPIDLYVRRFDLANVNQHLIKARFDSNPAPLVDLGLDVIFKYNDYKDSTLGRTKDWRQEYYVSAGYGSANSFRIYTFADLELVRYDSIHRADTGNTATVITADPGSGDFPTIYNWKVQNKDRSWQLGIGTEWQQFERLKWLASAIYGKTHGSADFSVNSPPAVVTGGVLPINSFDNTTRLALNLKAVYRHTRELQFTAGYAYEHWDYSDIGYDGFRYTLRAGAATQTSYFTGQQAFQPYNANIVYVMATYRFR